MKKLLLATLFISLCTPVKPFNWQPIAQAARSCTEWVHSNPGKFVAGATALAALGYIGYRGYTYYMTSSSKIGSSLRPQRTNETGQMLYSANDPYISIIQQIGALYQGDNDLCGIHAVFNAIEILDYLQKNNPLFNITQLKDNPLFSIQNFNKKFTKMKNLILQTRQTSVLQEWLFYVLKENNQQGSNNESFEQVFERNLGNVAKAIALRCISKTEDISSVLTKNAVINTLTKQEPICSMIQKNIFDTLLTKKLKENPNAQNDEEQELQAFINQMFENESLKKRFNNEMNDVLEGAHKDFIKFINELMKKKYTTSDNVEDLDSDEIQCLLDHLLNDDQKKNITILGSIGQFQSVCGEGSNTHQFKQKLANSTSHAYHIFIFGTMNEQENSTGHWYIVVAEKEPNEKEPNEKLKFLIADSLNNDNTKRDDIGVLHFLLKND